ncbi:dTDP-4-dehydrorhamnose reductase [Sphingomonas colocasiae]|uniref:dTDP-4-dehydrorhamnose reductase n=1 Tax=Sphingomonas colocasiae TaxID=1848973 RepID=A0ABS7PJZ0_9SPHN|nr:dTDP-4-dehydrorhamnose reductase [Sphingomonas colocasiae]MBY8820802.1 dTDP-4-dehydrorhamnose reductase [Sphingomonas colocasiae]
MRLLLLGAEGQVGRAMRAACPADASLIALGRDACDLSDEASVRAAIANAECDWLVNAAAYTAVDRAESDEALARTVNGTAPGWIGAAARMAGIRVAHISTDFVFDGSAGTPYRPDSPTNPLSAYGRSKLAGETALHSADPDALIVRTSWVHAAQGSNFPLTMLRLMRERDEIRVVADQTGSPTWATTLADSLWRLIAADASGTHHLTDAGIASWYDLAMAVAEEALALGLLPRIPTITPIATEDYPTPARRPAYSVLDKSSAWALLGGPTPHWRLSLRNMLKEVTERA